MVILGYITGEILIVWYVKFEETSHGIFSNLPGKVMEFENSNLAVTLSTYILSMLILNRSDVEVARSSIHIPLYSTYCIDCIITVLRIIYLGIYCTSIHEKTNHTSYDRSTPSYYYNS